MSSNRKGITGINNIQDKTNQLLAYRAVYRLVEMKLTLEDPRNNPNEYQRSNECKQAVTEVQACLNLLGFSARMLEDEIDRLVARMIKKPFALIPNREIIIPGALTP